MEKTLPQNVREIIEALTNQALTPDQAVDAIVECTVDTVADALRELGVSLPRTQ